MEVKKNHQQLTEQLLNEILKEKVEDVSPSFKESSVSEEQKQRIFDNIVTKHPSLNRKYAMVATILLFLKGAASNNTPDNLDVEVKGVLVTKKDLKNAFFQIVGNYYLRRLAESMAIAIGKYAEVNKLDGELASRLNKLIAERNTRSNSSNQDILPLTFQERAWASSFSQSIKDLNKYTSQKVINYLAEDYLLRFGKKQIKK